MKEQIEEMAFDLCRIDTCKHLPQEECDNTTCAHCAAEALYNAGYRKQEWISVEDRLPEKEGKYLICTINGYVTFGYFADWGDGNITLLRDNPRFDYRNVIYWMPLPEPPKMKGGE